MDWAALPPEINSARMYTGPGAAPILSASSAWAAIASQLAEAAENITSTVTGLAEAWMGPSATAMTQAAATYLQWLTTTASLAAHTAAQAQAAGAAFETAYAAIVPPPVIATNRTLLAALVATNLLGSNTPAIMATEAQYMQMWAQDAAVMFEYQAASARASQLTPFKPLASIATGVQAITPPSIAGEVRNILTALQTNGWPLLNEYIQSLISSAPYDIPIQILSLFTNMWVITQATSGSTAAANAAADAATETANAVANAPVPVVNVGAPSIKLGAAPAVGRLSVPASWAAAIDKPITVLNQTPIIPGGEPDMSPGMPGMFSPMMPAGGTPERVRYGIPIDKVITRHPSGG